METLIAFAPSIAISALAIAMWIRSGAFCETFGIVQPTWRSSALAIGVVLAFDVMAATGWLSMLPRGLF